jgi:hypothetical protein
VLHRVVGSGGRREPAAAGMQVFCCRQWHPSCPSSASSSPSASFPVPFDYTIMNDLQSFIFAVRRFFLGARALVHGRRRMPRSSISRSITRACKSPCGRRRPGMNPSGGRKPVPPDARGASLGGKIPLRPATAGSACHCFLTEAGPAAFSSPGGASPVSRSWLGRAAPESSRRGLVYCGRSSAEWRTLLWRSASSVRSTCIFVADS